MTSWTKLLALRGLRTLTATDRITSDSSLDRVNQGVMFHVSSLASLASDANLDLILTTPANDFIHMVVEGACQGNAELALYEDAVATGGTTVVPRNQKRTSSLLWGGTIVVDPSVSDAGTRLALQLLPGGNKSNSSGTVQTVDGEWILRASTRYLIRLTNRVTGQAQSASIGCTFYSSPEVFDTKS